MGFEGQQKNEELEVPQKSQECSELKQHPEWSKVYKHEMSIYGSLDYRHLIEMEYKDQLEKGEIDFKEALNDYTERMTGKILQMKMKMKKIAEDERKLYGDRK